MQLDNETIKRLRGIGHHLKPIVTIGSKGLTQNIIDETDRALNDHELIKIRLPAGSKDEREQMANELAKVTHSKMVHTIGRMGLLLRKNPDANPNLSNIVRHTY